LAKKISIVHGNLAYFEPLARIFNEYEPEQCFRLGAQAIVTVSNRNLLSTFNSNIKGAWHILEAARKSSIDLNVGLIETFKWYEDFSLSK